MTAVTVGIWVAAERSCEAISLTDPYCGWRRDALMLVAPVPGMMELAGANTGRPSMPRRNSGVLSRLRSRDPIWSMP